MGGLSAALVSVLFRAVPSKPLCAYRSLLTLRMAEDAVKKYMSTKGEFVRRASQFRDWITADGSSGFKAESGRYHLYVCLACPWAHRTLMLRQIKGLDDVISVTVVDWLNTEFGWKFTDTKPKCTLDTLNNCEYVRDVYKLANPDYSGAITVPVLWDKQKKTIVNNESSEIIRMLNTEFNAFCRTGDQRQIDLYPTHLRDKIDEVNSWVYDNINNGVYKCGFARSQQAYDDAVENLFVHLEKVEGILSQQRYLTGSELTEADIRLFSTLVRFDWVYHTLFKCNKKRLIQYPNIWAYTRDLYTTHGIGNTVDQQHIQHHYYESLTSINPFRVVAVGPDLDFTEPHGREKL